jgi:hypothetical protein
MINFPKSGKMNENGNETSPSEPSSVGNAYPLSYKPVLLQFSEHEQREVAGTDMIFVFSRRVVGCNVE